MKNKFLILVILLIPFLTMAQETPANTFYEKYSGQEGYTSVYITQYMFELFAKINNDEEDKEFKEITSKLNSIKILTIDSALNVKSNRSFDQELLSSLPETIYKDLMVIKDGKQTVRFLINEKKNQISEFLMVVYGDGDPVLIFLEGDIDLKQVSKLSKTMNVDGFEYLENVDKK
jgi:hypothetical protein